MFSLLTREPLQSTQDKATSLSSRRECAVKVFPAVNALLINISINLLYIWTTQNSIQITLNNILLTRYPRGSGVAPLFWRLTWSKRLLPPSLNSLVGLSAWRGREGLYQSAACLFVPTLFI